MPALVELEFDGKKAKVALTEARSRAQDLTPAFQEIGELLLLEIDEGFETETDPFGVKWPKNSAYTIARKKAEGGILKVLQYRGLMRASINSTADRTQLQISTNDPKARKHQLGIGVPVRKFMGFSDENKQIIKRMMTNYVITGSTDRRGENRRP